MPLGGLDVGQHSYLYTALGLPGAPTPHTKFQLNWPYGWWKELSGFLCIDLLRKEMS